MTIPVTYAKRRATWFFFIETHHRTFFVLSTFEFFDRTSFYKHFGSKDELLMESLRQAFREVEDTLVGAAEESPPQAAWKGIVNVYLSREYCEHAGRGCPLTALSPELARSGKRMRSQIFAELVKYKDRMLPFMPGQRASDKERAFFVIFSTMVGAVEIARMLPDRSAQEKVLASARDFLLSSF